MLFVGGYIPRPFRLNLIHNYLVKPRRGGQRGSGEKILGFPAGGDHRVIAKTKRRVEAGRHEVHDSNRKTW